MKTLPKILFLTGFVGLLWMGCSRQVQPTPQPVPTPGDTISTGNLSAIDAFPNQTGDSWTYTAYDSIDKITKTINVKIIGDTVFTSGKSGNIRTYNYPFDTGYGSQNVAARTLDTEYVSVDANSVNFIAKDAFYSRRYVFPLYAGKTWQVPHLTSVVKVETITVPAGKFTKCFDIRTVIPSYNYVLIIEDWLKPKVGIVQRYIYERDMAPPDIQVWKLKSYKLTN